MSSIADSLRKQNTLLQAEVERFAAGVDGLSMQLVETQTQLAQSRARVAELSGQFPVYDDAGNVIGYQSPAAPAPAEVADLDANGPAPVEVALDGDVITPKGDYVPAPAV